MIIVWGPIRVAPPMDVAGLLPVDAADDLLLFTVDLVGESEAILPSACTLPAELSPSKLPSVNWR